MKGQQEKKNEKKASNLSLDPWNVIQMPQNGARSSPRLINVFKMSLNHLL